MRRGGERRGEERMEAREGRGERRREEGDYR
jgi:hypothetical protein